MSDRPIYVGMGHCKCGRLEVRLYRVPKQTQFECVCSKCLEGRGMEVPKPLTAEDVSDKFLFGAPKEKKEAL